MRRLQLPALGPAVTRAGVAARRERPPGEEVVGVGLVGRCKKNAPQAGLCHPSIRPALGGAVCRVGKTPGTRAWATGNKKAWLPRRGSPAAFAPEPALSPAHRRLVRRPRKGRGGPGALPVWLQVPGPGMRALHAGSAPTIPFLREELSGARIPSGCLWLGSREVGLGLAGWSLSASSNPQAP